MDYAPSLTKTWRGCAWIPFNKGIWANQPTSPTNQLLNFAHRLALNFHAVYFGPESGSSEAQAVLSQMVDIARSAYRAASGRRIPNANEPARTACTYTNAIGTVRSHLMACRFLDDPLIEKMKRSNFLKRS
jgi:hypothetical protein